MKNTVEFRRDPVSGEWILVSTTVRKKPVFFARSTVKPFPKSNCPFEPARIDAQEESLMWLPRPGKNTQKDWWVRIFPNKYPVVSHSRVCPPTLKYGLYEHKSGVGFQELVVTRDHERSFGQMSNEEIRLVLESYISRYHALSGDSCVEYILIIHNHGLRAGATVPHPHSQIFAIPIVPPDVARSISGSRSYFHKNRRCVHCDIIRWEVKEKKRIICQNKYFVALAPFASKVAYEVRVFPKVHESRFEAIDDEQRKYLAEALRETFSRIRKKLNDPDYNFFIHTSPPKEAHSRHYHWHMEILPRVAIWGGLELGAGIEVVKISPEETAKLLRK